MKTVFIKDILLSEEGEFEVSGWVCAKRCQGKITFLDLCDSTGKIQVVVTDDGTDIESFHLAKHLHVESGITVKGTLKFPSDRLREIAAKSITVVGDVTKDFTPHPRGVIDIFDTLE